jgi:hypothetical protein
MRGLRLGEDRRNTHIFKDRQVGQFKMSLRVFLQAFAYVIRLALSEKKWANGCSTY